MHGFLAIARRSTLAKTRGKTFFTVRALAVAVIGLYVTVSLWAALWGPFAGAIPGRDIYGDAFLSTVAIGQVLLLAPCAIILGASTVGRERREGTLDILLVTGMRPLAVEGGLAVGSLVPIVLGLLASLPVGLLLLLSADLPLHAAFLAYGIAIGMATFVVGLSTLLSTVISRPNAAPAVSGVVVVLAFWIIPNLAQMFRLSPAVQQAAGWYSPFEVIGGLRDETISPTLFAQVLTWVVTGAICVGVGAWLLPRLTEKGARRPARKRRRVLGPRLPSRNPVLWLESRRGPIRIWSWIVAGLLLIVVGGPLALLSTWRFAGVFAGLWFSSSSIWLLLWILTIYHSVGAFAAGRRRDTLPLILASPLSKREIIFGTAAAIAIKLLPFLCLYLAIHALGFSGMVVERAPWQDPEEYVMILLMVGKGLTGLLLAMALGLYFSLRTRSTLMALGWTVGGVIATYIIGGLALAVSAVGSPYAWFGWRALADLLIVLIVTGVLFTRFDRLVGRCSSDVRDLRDPYAVPRKLPPPAPGRFPPRLLGDP